MIAAIHSGFLSATAALFLLASLCRAEDPTPKSRGGESKPAPPSPVGWPATDRDLYPSSLGGGRPFDLLIRGDRSRFGRFDPDGNFIPEPRHESFSGCGPLGGPISFFSNQVTGAVAEHRSGRLILGTMVKGVFVPELGSKVLDIKKDFDIKKPDRIVYNLFWETVPAWTAERKKQFPKGLPNDPEPPPAGVPAGWKLIPFWQADPKQQDPWHVRVIGEIAEFGHLDEQGEFIPDVTVHPITNRGAFFPAR